MGNENLARMSRAVIIILTVSVVLITVALAVAIVLPASPQVIAERFLRARYAQKAGQLYELASSADRAERTLQEFIEVNPPFPEPFQRGADALAATMRFSVVDISRAGEQARVKIRAVLPNAADDYLKALLHGTEASGAFGSIESPREVVRSIRADSRSGQLPMVEVTETVDLIREGRHWRVVMGWEVDVSVTLGVAVADGLPLEFTIVSKPELRLRPGETGRATFSLRNISEEPIRTIATHTYMPPTAQRYIELIQCFCFFEERLDPGEYRDLSLVFRLDWDLPSTINSVGINYRYDPAKSSK